jgi:hypothetical protein
MPVARRRLLLPFEPVCPSPDQVAEALYDQVAVVMFQVRAMQAG